MYVYDKKMHYILNYNMFLMVKTSTASFVHFVQLAFCHLESLAHLLRGVSGSGPSLAFGFGSSFGFGRGFGSESGSKSGSPSFVASPALFVATF